MIVGTLLLNLDTVARRMYAAIYVATSLHELSTLFDMPKEDVSGPVAAWFRSLAAGGAPDVQRRPSPRRTDRCSSSDSTWKSCRGKRSASSPNQQKQKPLALVLAGLYHPTGGVIRHNDIDLRACR